jgi:penicillin amidase/acyl-homoserine-lactone acylase
MIKPGTTAFQRLSWLCAILLLIPGVFACASDAGAQASGRPARPAAKHRPAPPAATHLLAPPGRIIVYRDSYGVPSIVANSLADAIYGLGYAQAMDNPERMALNFKMARGRLSEVQGKKYIMVDAFIRAIGFEESSEDEWKRIPEPIHSVVQSYADGANRAIAEQKGKIPDWIRPFTPIDVLAFVQVVNSAVALQRVAQEAGFGINSNQFAAAPSRTATGAAILSMDPHFTLNDFMQWHEFGLYTPDIRFRGIGLPGTPVGNMGHTAYVAWSMTNNDPTLATLYTVTTNPNNPRQYSYHGEWRDFVDQVEEINYLEDGVMKSQKLPMRLTAWGPMVPLKNFAVNLSTVGIADPTEIFKMLMARDANQFRAALAPHTISMWNIVYADTKGNIGYQYNARVPRRDPIYDWTKVVPGADPGTRLGSLLDDDELPHILNPRSGLLVNCNSAPWLTPLDEEISNRWPSYVSTYGPSTRHTLLSAAVLRSPKMTPEQAMSCATDTTVPNAKETVAELLHFGEGNADVKDALDVLRGWDGHAEIASVGCGLYVYWLRADRDNYLRADRAGALRGWTTEEGRAAVAALQKAAASMMKDHGRLNVSWGEMHYLVRGTKKIPCRGFGYVSDSEASVCAMAGPFTHGDIVVNFGSTFRMIVSLEPKGVRSWSILPYGECQRPDSPHFADQADLYANGKYKPTHFALDEMVKSAVEKRVLQR